MADSTSLVDQLEQQQAEFRKNAQDMQQLFFGVGQNAAQKAALEAKSGENVNGRFETPESFAVRAQADLEAQLEKKSFAATLDHAALSYELAMQTRDTVRTQMTQAAKIQEDKSVSLFEDPASAIINAFTLPWDMQELEGTNTRLALLTDAKAKLDTTVQQHAQSTDALKQSLTAATNLELVTALGTRQKIREIDATNAALMSDAQGIEAVARMDAMGTNAAVRVLEVQNAEESRKLTRERLDAEKEMRDERLKKMKENEAALTAGITAVNDGRRRDGLPPLDRTQILFGLNQPKGSKAGEQFGNWLDRGVMLSSGTVPFDGENALERAAYRNSVGMRPKNSRQESLMQLDIDAVAAASKNSKDKNVIATEADKMVRAKMNDWKSNIVPGDTSNPFQPPSYDAIIDMGLSGMKAYPVLATLLTDANKNNPIDQQQVFDTLLAAVIKRDITGNDAAVLMATMYGKTMLAVNLQSDAQKLTGEPLKQWNAKIDTVGNALGGKYTVARFLPMGKAIANLTDPVIVQNLIQRAVVMQLGAAINWNSEYPDTPNGGGFYPPLFKSGVVAPKLR
jgi:type II secretory pathway component PulJ